MRILLNCNRIIEASIVNAVGTVADPMDCNSEYVNYGMTAINDDGAYEWLYDIDDNMTIEQAKAKVEADMKQLLIDGWLDMSDYTFTYIDFEDDEDYYEDDEDYEE